MFHLALKLTALSESSPDMLINLSWNAERLRLAIVNTIFNYFIKKHHWYRYYRQLYHKRGKICVVGNESIASEPSQFSEYKVGPI